MEPALPVKTLPPIVLLDSDSLTALQIARILWRKKVPVIGIATEPNTSYFCHTRSVRRTVDVADFSKDPARLLQEIEKQYGCRPVLLACSDEYVMWLNDRRNDIEPYANLLMPDPETIRLLVDKARFYRYAAQHGLPVPKTCYASTAADLETAGQEIGFPLILKPPLRSPEWVATAGNRKVLRIDSAEELQETGGQLLALGGELILQAWVHGPQSNSRELLVCMSRQNELLATVVLQKLRQHPPDTGVGSLAVEIETKEVLDAGTALLQTLHYSGLGQLEFKQDERDGRYYIIEMNAGRPAMNSALSEACGVEMAYTFYCAAAGLPLPERRTVTRPGAKWICWKYDLTSSFVHWRQGHLSLREWLLSLHGHKWSADIQLDDPHPLFAAAVKKIKRRTNRNKEAL